MDINIFHVANLVKGDMIHLRLTQIASGQHGSSLLDGGTFSDFFIRKLLKLCFKIV